MIANLITTTRPMNLWLKYATYIRNNILISCSKKKDLKYWQDDMFANTILYILPLSLIALIPSLIWSYKMELYTMIIVDIAAVLLTCIIAFKKNIPLKNRKTIFITTAYTLSTFLVYYAGLNSTLFLLATCFLSLFIFTFDNQYTPAYINIAISVTYIVLISNNILPDPAIIFESTVLFAVFSNLIFLSLLMSALVPQLFKGLDESFKKSIEHYEKIDKQNELLKEITWIQSHVVRAPLSRLMAITYLLKDFSLTDEEKKFFIENIIISSNELDTIIQEIVTKSESIRSS
ncbi:hypothetical protein [Flavobacterium algicola]|uniref:hypothetical protein n=1 Tax=Flavobacterium algicola TaxID=556529 RepID=UPI001EFDB181|nr:hypothetical protein [Flavobacterium algicola]MCG9793576.1 hypothetical protein [Flavobacterium algicola]